MSGIQRSNPWRLVAVLTLSLPALGLAQTKPDWSGFALLGGSSQAEGTSDVDSLSAQLQLGVDWYPSPLFGAHAHLLARSDAGDSMRGTLGVVEAFVEANAFTSFGRLRLRGGAMFLPTSYENVDALWENPFTISSSALNSWLGHEFRPVGIDGSWFDNGFMLGGTIFRGNDTFGALPPVRGWTLSDRWTLVGQKVRVNDTVFTSVSAESDGRLGWSARAGWSGEHLSAQYTHINNRSDGLRYDDLYNWNTRFHIVGTGYSVGEWTFAAEAGWGPTYLVVRGRKIVSDIHAAYGLISRRFSHGRVSFRVDAYDDDDVRDEALTMGCTLTPTTSLRAAVELVTTGSTNRVQLEIRYGF